VGAGSPMMAAMPEDDMMVVEPMDMARNDPSEHDE
jgi:hypothetical protein